MQLLNRDDVYEFHRPLENFWLGTAETGFQPNPEFLNLLYQQPRIIANLSTEHWGDGDYPMCVYMSDVLSEHQNCIILSHNPMHDHLKPNIFYFPWWLYRSHVAYTLDIEATVSVKQSRKFISCINMNPRPNRIRMLRLLDESGLSAQGIVTRPIRELHDPIHDPLDKSYWHEQESDQPCVELSVQDIFSTDWAPYQDAWLHIVTESSHHDGIFLTEKTWKCIATAQLFVVVGGRNSVQHIRDLGFDTFDDIVPHEIYDGLVGYENRCDSLLNVLLGMQHLDWQNIYRVTEQRRLKNRDRLLNSSVCQQYISHIEQTLGL